MKEIKSKESNLPIIFNRCKFCGYDIKPATFEGMWINIHADKTKEKRNPNRFSYDLYCMVDGKYRRHLPED